MPPTSVKSVLAGADMVVKAYALYATQMRAAGVLPKDIDTVTGLAAALRTVDTAQEAKKIGAKESTAARKAAQFRVEAAMGKIIAAAELEFVEVQERLKQYHAVIPARPKTKKTPKSA